MRKRYYQPLPIKILCFLFALGTIFYACNSPTSPEEPESTWWEPLLAQQDSFSKDTSPLELSLSLSSHKISTDDSLTMTISVRNTSKDSLILEAGGTGITNTHYDFIVLQSDTSFIWNRLPDVLSLSAITMLIAPDEVLTFEEIWELKDRADNRVGEGTYLVFGGFLDYGYYPPPLGNYAEWTDLGRVATEMQEIVVE